MKSLKQWKHSEAVKSEVLYAFTPTKSDAYLLTAELSNAVFLKTYNTDFDEIIVTFTNEIGRLLKKEHKFNLTLLINKSE